MPERCGYKPTHDSPRVGPSVGPCKRDPYDGSSGYCIFHTQDEKSVEELNDALQTTNKAVVGANLSGFRDATTLDVAGSVLYNADFSESNLSGVDFSDAIIIGSDFVNADLSGADFSENNQLDDIDFSSANCTLTDFSESSIDEADFTEASLIDTHFENSRVSETDFRRTRVIGADVYCSRLYRCSFVGATVTRVDFSRSEFEKVDFVSTTIHDSIFMNCVFSDLSLQNIQIDSKTELDRMLLQEFVSDRMQENDTDSSEAEYPVSHDEYDVGTGGCESSPEADLMEPYWSSLTRPKQVLRGAQRFSSRISCTPREEDDKKLQEAEETYRVFKKAYRNSSLADEARKLNVREKECRRKREAISLRWGGLSTSRWLMGYGEYPLKVLVFLAAAWVLFAVPYGIFGITAGSGGAIQHFSLQGNLDLGFLFDLFILSGRRLFTFSNGTVSPASYGVLLATGQSIIGALAQAALIFTLGRRATS